ncbi:MAG TPA: hypothetical protein VMT27_09475, partial [Actinomycetes bacterium]|nr:hypothetical protein [Actinomycetes bacterium]
MTTAALVAVAVYLLVPGRGLTRATAQWSVRWDKAWRRLTHRGAALRWRQRSAEAAIVVEFSLSLAAELRAGQPPIAAWSSVSPMVLSPSAGGLAAQLSHEDVVRMLRTASVRPGRGGLARVAACWEVSEQSGAGLADAL